MVRTRTDRPIVVGLDGSETAWRALDWAAAEAVREGSELRLVHAYDLQVRRAPALPVATRLVRFEAGRRLLDAAEHHLNEFHPGLGSSTALRAGAASRVLLRTLGEGARLLVLGQSHAGRLSSATGGSTVLTTEGSARLPTVVVPPTWPTCAEPRWHERRAVLVGVDDTSHSAAALDFAVQAAVSRSARLIVVHAWELVNPYIANASMIEQQMRDGLESAELYLDKVLSDATADHPGLEIETICPRRHAAAALLEQAPRADLAVIGGRRHTRLGTLFTGTTTRTLLKRSPCPLAIVHG